MNNQGQEKGLSDSKRKCGVCETYQRKIDDVEQNLSGRDQIITILQGRLKKCETNYKNLFDEFEKLRFEHCTALQDNYSLKEINSKLEQFDLKTKCNDLRGSGSHPNRHINNNPDTDNQRKYQESRNQAGQEVSHIESLVYSQNQVLKQLLDKIINELKSCNCDNPEITQNIDKIQENFKSIESGDHLNFDPKLLELSTQVESLKTLLVKCQEENERMKKLLQDKKNNFSECQNILQHTSRSIGKISISIDDLVKSKSVVKKNQEVSCCLPDPAAKLPNMDEKVYKRRISELETTLKEKEKEHDCCKGEMLSQMNDIADNNQVLSDTLEVIKAENKNNLQAVAKLKEELKRVNEECEQKQKELKERITQLENELEERYVNEKKLRSSLDESNSETKDLKQKLNVVCEEDKNPNCNCSKWYDGGCKLKQKVEELQCTCGEMHKDLTEKTLELSEYEEENRALKQKIACMTHCGDKLRKKLKQCEEAMHGQNGQGEKQFANFNPTGYSPEEGRCLGDDCYVGQQQKLKEIERLNQIVQMQEEEIKQLKNRNDEPRGVPTSSHVPQDGRCLGDDCYLGQTQKLKEIERLNNRVHELEDEIENLKKINEELSLGNFTKPSSHVPQDGRCLGDDCYVGQTQKLKEIERLTNRVHEQEDEIENLKKINEELSLGTFAKPTSHVVEEGRCLGDDCYLGQQQKLKEIERLNNLLKLKDEEIKQMEQKNQEFNFGDMVKRTAHVVEEGRCLGDDCYVGQQQKLKEIDRLNNVLKMRDEEIKKLTKRIEELSLGDLVKPSSHVVGELRCLGDDCYLGQQQKLIEIERLNSLLKMRDDENRKLTKRIEELSLGDLVKKSSHKVEEGRCLGTDCQMEKKNEIDRLNMTVKLQEEEMKKLTKRIEELNFGVLDQKSSHVVQGGCAGNDCNKDQRQGIKEAAVRLDVVEDIERLNNALKMRDEEIKKLNKTIHELRLEDSGKKSGHLIQEGRCLGDDCYLGQRQKLKEIERLNSLLRIKEEEIRKLSRKNESSELMTIDLSQRSRGYLGKKSSQEGGGCCNPGQQQKINDIDRLNKVLKIQGEEIDKLTKENDELRISMHDGDISQLRRENADLAVQIERLKSENKKETERLQGMVNHSQKQVELLLKEHDEKTAQIQCVANELDGIRRSVTEENDTFLSTIEDLKRERDELKDKVEEYEKDPGCKCEAKSLEIERAKSEIYKKQCVILELEKSIDTFNHTLKQFEQNIEVLASENASLKDDKEKQLKEAENLRNKLRDKVSEMGKIHDQLQTVERACESCTAECRALERANEKLKDEVDAVQREYDRTRRSLETEKLALQMEVASLKEEHNTAAALCSKLDSTQKAYDDLRNQCAKKCFENEKLQEEIQNKTRVIEDLKAKAETIQCECEKLKIQNRTNIEEQYKIGQKMTNLQDCCDKITRQYTSKCLENDELQSKLNHHRKENSQSCTDCEGLKKKMQDAEQELGQATEKCGCMQQEYDKKCQEFKRLKKQYDSCCKQSQISREEYNNLRKEYKEIKKMLADQIKRYRKETDSMEASQSGPQNKSCKLVCDLKRQLLEKEKEILSLQQKLKDSSYEIIELKDYIHKLITDNNILKSAINNLIGNLERKIKGPNTADALAGEILQSLTTIESTIIKKAQNQYCPPTCTSKDCDCMLQIQSQYNKESEQDNRECCSDYNLQKETSVSVPVYQCSTAERNCPALRNVRATNSIDPCMDVTYGNNPSRDFCEQGPSRSKVDSKVHFTNDDCFEQIKCHGNFCTNMSIQSTNVVSDMSTTDSEDCPCSHAFLDKNSVDFLKETIQGLKISKDNTMKEKSCDCERC